MTMLLWLPLAGLLIVAVVVATPSAVARGHSPRTGWSLAPDGLRLVGSLVLALGVPAALWLGVGDHQPRAVLAGRAPFDWPVATLVAAGALLCGGGLLLVDRFRRAR